MLAFSNDSAFLYVPFSLYSHMKHEFLFCTSRHRHRLWLNHDIQLLTLAHISVILGRRQSWQPHIGHPGTMRQAGRQLYYCSGMAGSAEGEALTSILMRLRSAVTKRMQEDQAETITQLPESIWKTPSLHHLKKKVTCSLLLHLKPLNLWNILTHYCTLTVHNSPNKDQALISRWKQQPLLVN